MIRIWQLIIHGCAHVWVDTAQARYQKSFGREGPVVYCKCRKCGRHTRFFNAAMQKDTTQ